jgi:hypothetical protein
VTDRSEVYAALDSERAYQDQRWTASNTKGSPDQKRQHSIEEWITYMEDYLSDAKHILSREEYPACDERAVQIMRKVTAMGVACMENHGAPRREGF